MANDEQKQEPEQVKPETVETPDVDSNLLPILFCAIKTLGGKIGVRKQQLDNFPKDFGVQFEYNKQDKVLVCTCVEPRRRGVLIPHQNRKLILPN